MILRRIICKRKYIDFTVYEIKTAKISEKTHRFTHRVACLSRHNASPWEPWWLNLFFRLSIAAPAFIKKLLPYHGYVYNSPNVSIMCWVECAPMCNISWLKNGVPMDFTKTNRYYLMNVLHPPDPRTNDFESIQSTLVWNLTAWPSGQLDRVEDNVKFTCESSSNGIGSGVKSSTHFHVECKLDFFTFDLTFIKFPFFRINQVYIGEIFFV